MEKERVITIPAALYARLEAVLHRLGFATVDDTVAQLIRQHLTQVDADEVFTEEEEEEVKDRLRALGYLD